MATAIDPTAPGERVPQAAILPFGQKLAYASPELFAALSVATVNSWFLYFLVNAAGMAPVLAGTAFVVGRLFDAVLDPVVGVWSDRVRPRRGRSLFVAWAAIPTALAFAALWALPLVVEGEAARFVFATLGFMAFSLGYTALTIPRGAQLPELAPDYDDRTTVVAVQQMAAFASILVAIALTPALVLGLSGGESLAAAPGWAWVAVGAGFALIGPVACLPYVLGLREPRGPEAAMAAKPAPSTIGELRALFETPGYATILGLFLAYPLGVLLVQSMTPFYLESVVGVPGPEQAPILGGIFVLSILCFPPWAWVGRRVGKRAGFVLGVAIYAVFLLWVPFIPREGVTGTLVAACVFAGVGISAIMMFPWTIAPDAVDLDTAHHGRPREGLVQSSFVFAFKLASSVSIFWNAIMLEIFGHEAGQVAQDERTVTAFVWMTGPVPLVVFLVAALLAWRYPVDRARQRAMRARIEAGARAARDG